VTRELFQTPRSAGLQQVPCTHEAPAGAQGMAPRQSAERSSRPLRRQSEPVTRAGPHEGRPRAEAAMRQTPKAWTCPAGTTVWGRVYRRGMLPMNRGKERKQLDCIQTTVVEPRPSPPLNNGWDGGTVTNSRGGESCQDPSPTASGRKSAWTVSNRGGGRTRIPHVGAFGTALQANWHESTNVRINEYSRHAHGKVGRCYPRPTCVPSRAATDFAPRCVLMNKFAD
jgi:hypothetical protein